MDRGSKDDRNSAGRWLRLAVGIRPATGEGYGMPFRSRRTLEAWLEEFVQLGYPASGSLKVMDQDSSDGEDTGLVGVQLAYASTVTYLQPDGPYSTRWVATMEPREAPVVLDSAGLLHLSTELATVSALCAFLQAKSAVLRDDSES